MKLRLRHFWRTALLVLVLLALALAAATQTGWVERRARDAIVARLEQMTGGRVELDAFHFHLLGLRAELDGLTIHGLEPAGTPPLLHVDRVRLSLRLAALLSRRIALGEVDVERPSVQIRVEPDGTSNVPKPKVQRAPSRPVREQLFALTIRRLVLDDGSLLYNDVRVPLVAEGDQFNFVMSYTASAGGKEYYQGTLSWHRVVLAARRYLPFHSDVGAKFTFTRSQFSLDEFRWELPQSEIEARTEPANFAQPNWIAHYRLRLNLNDIRSILRKPRMPTGVVESTGEVHYGGGQWSLRGYYGAQKISMGYQWFHTNGLESRGTVHASDHSLEVPDFQAGGLGGVVDGRVDLDFHGLHFRADTRARGMSLAAILAAVDNASFPVHTLAWDGSVDVDSLTTWAADFQHLSTRGQTVWSSLGAKQRRKIPASALINFDYEMDQRAVMLRQSEITTSTSRLELDGRLGASDSALAAKLDAKDLLDWNNFINYLRGPDAEPRTIGGHAVWDGELTGPLSGPTFAGHVRVLKAVYDQLNWDAVEGDLTYSPDELRLSNAHLRRGQSSADLDLWLELDHWSFDAENRWSVDVRLARADTDDLQGLFGVAVPARAQLSGEFRGSGTRADPQLHGDVSLADVQAWKFQFEQASGQLDLRHDELRITHAELSRDSGRIAGNLSYRFAEQEIAFDLEGASIPLEQIAPIQFATLPLGGRFDFTVRGQGTLAALTSAGSLRVSNLRVGDEVLGSFEGRLAADGRRVQLDLNSAMNTGKLGGSVVLTLGGDYPLRGELSMEQIDLDPFIKSGLHLKALTGHSRVDGKFVITGALRQPDTISVEADISHMSLDYETVSLESTGPLQLIYRRSEVHVEHAQLHGPNTDLTLSGSVRFNEDRPLSLKLAGTVDLRLLGGFVPGLEASGAAQVDVLARGTFSNPRITGRAHIADASASYGDFPAVLSQVNGDFVFDRSRLFFDNVQAAAGGGTVVLSGSVSYGQDTAGVRYEIRAQAQRARIRYPEGMSWLTDADLNLAGSTQGALLSGQVVVRRLLLAPGVDLASLIVASHGGTGGPGTVSPFLSNLQLDVTVTTTPDARMEWTGASLSTDASLRIRGTGDRPVVLGHIHLLTGDVTLRGNRYRLARGDLNFSNPFRLDPVMNIEATTTIDQFEVTLDVSGPASAMKLSYRSDPPLPESDVLGLLALGHTGEESGLRTASSQGAQSGASALLSEAISSQVGGRLQRLFGISRFQVDPFLAGTGSEPNAAARVTIQQQLTHDLTITYSSNATANQQQVIQVEYAVSRDVSIIALRDINGTFGLDVKFKKRFK